MTADEFRRLALAFPDAVEREHMGHPDFRAGEKGRIFATLSHDGSYAVVMLTPEQQESIVASAPAVFSNVKGGWGRGGATEVILKKAKAPAVKKALAAAFRNKASPKILQKLDG